MGRRLAVVHLWVRIGNGGVAFRACGERGCSVGGNPGGGHSVCVNQRALVSALRSANETLKRIGELAERMVERGSRWEAYNLRTALAGYQPEAGERLTGLEETASFWQTQSQYNYDCGVVLWTESENRVAKAEARAAELEAKLAPFLEEEQRQKEWNAFCAVSDVRCLDCNLRYGEREQYGCGIEARNHYYDEDELREARRIEE